MGVIRTIPLLLLSLASAAQAGEYTTYIGAGVPVTVVRALTDSSGNTYLAGNREGSVFVMKLDATGHTVFFRDISGQGPDAAADMAIDPAGNIYVGGATSSSSFPLHNPMQLAYGPGFLAKVSADGSQLVWSTYFREAITALAVDAGGNVYITGKTNDGTFPVTPGLPNGQATQGASPVSAAFFTKIAAAGDRIVYSALISGNAKDCGSGSSCFLSERNTRGVSVAVDAAGNAYLAGNTDVHDLPATAGAFLPVGAGPFVAKVKADGSGLVYLTYLSFTEFPSAPATNPGSTAAALAVDAAGDAYVAGTTFDTKFPVTAGAYQTAYSGPSVSFGVSFPPPDLFVVRLNPAGSQVVWGTYLGGIGAEAVNSIAVDSSQQVWLAGTTASSDFPNAQGWFAGSDFVTGLSSSGAKLVYSARFPNDGASRSIAVDAAGMLHVAGPTGIVSAIQPAGAPLQRIFGVANAAAGPLDGRVGPGEVISIYGPHIGPATPVIAAPDSNGDLPTSIQGYQAILTLPNAAPLPLMYISDSQINAVVPFGSYQSGALHVVTPSGTTPDFVVNVVAARPEIFKVILNQDGTVNSQSNPAGVGSYASIWMTGSGALAVGNAGHIATAAQNYFCCGIDFNSGVANVVYAGNAPGVALGVTQINFQVPALPSPFNPSFINVVARDGSMSAPFSIWTRP